MADRTVQIITPATSIALMTLEEAKTMSGILVGDASQDDQIQLMIDQYSSAVSWLLNRVLAQESVVETWRDNGSRRLFLSHWPVVNSDEDPIIVESPLGTVLDPTSYELEERTGKLSIFSGQTDEVVVTYTGGYLLPTDAPDALKQALGVLIRQGRIEQAREAVTGIRSIQHKDSRIMFFDPNAGRSSTSTSTTSFTSTSAASTVDALLVHFRRLEV